MIAQIISIEAPASAKLNDQIVVNTHVRNVGSTTNYILVVGKVAYDGGEFLWEPGYLTLLPQQEGVFPHTFNMPGNLRYHVWSYYWDGTKWVWDDYKYVDIALATGLPEFRTGSFAVREYIKV